MKNTDLFIQEDDYSDLRSEEAVRHLSEAIQCQTVGFVDVDKVDFSQFDRLHEVLRRSFPLIFEKAEVKNFRKSLLIRLEGSDPSLRPGMFIAHQDVVPIIPGTEKNWTYPPFSGEIAEGCIWGRGTLDIKEMLIGIMESAEYLLEHQAPIRRTIYIAFGDDEETLNTGAETMGKYLQSQGVELEFVLDESTANVTDAAVYGAPGKLIYPIGIYEKGYADLFLKVKSQGGHSSNPFYGTSLGILAQSIASILDHPFRPELPDCAMETLLSLKPYMTLEPLKTLMEDPEGNNQAILDYFLSRKELYFQVQTTIAPTMITPGSQAGNVMPQDMEAVINYRLSPQDTTDSVLAHAREHIDERVEAGYVQCINASIPSETRSYGFRKLVSALEHSFKDLTFVPAINKGTTDAHNYECICRCCYRVSPFLEETEIAQKGIHGTDEHLSIRAYLQGIRTILRFMEETCVKVEE